MKKILTISDIHGRTCWKDFGDIKFLLTAEPGAAGFGPYEPDYELYVFLGDYTDSFTETNQTIRENLLEIIKFKTLYPNNVILLWGNHDVEYLKNLPWLKMDDHVSGFRPEVHYDLYDIFNTNKDLFQVAFKINNYLFSHAGVHFGWYHFVFTKAIKGMGMEDMNIAEQINEAFKLNLECIFDVDWYRGGRKKVGGPLWCSKQLIEKKPLKYCHQIVGHTPVDDFQKRIIGDASVTFCDVLHIKNEFYELNI
jgi:predicted MPP superfamily phosphohydrolase